MTLDPEELNRRIQRCADELRGAGVKLTHQRLEICREIMASPSHPDAETVCEGVRKRVPTISLDTVYRTLWTLLDLGLINTLAIPRERMRFDGNTIHHHHFICTRCGQAQDFYSKEFDNLQPPQEVNDYGTVQDTRVEVRGTCRRCSESRSQ